MAYNPNNVTASKPRVTGSIFVAPKGTSLPTTASASLGSAFKDLGYISDGGVSEDVTKTETKFKDWGGTTIYTTENSFENTFKFQLVEIMNVDVLKFAFGAANVTGSSTASPGISVSKKAGSGSACVIVIDSVLSGNVLKRTVIPNGTLSGIGTISNKSDTLLGIDCTVECAADSSGATSYDYYLNGTSGSSGSSGTS